MVLYNDPSLLSGFSPQCQWDDSGWCQQGESRVRSGGGEGGGGVSIELLE